MACRINCINLIFQWIMNINLWKQTKFYIIHTFFSVGLILNFSHTVSYAYDAGFHETLTETAIKYSDNYLNSLFLSGLDDNATEEVDIEGKLPSYWFKLGSSSEDYIQIALGAPEIDIELLIKVLFAARKNGLIGLLKIAGQPVINSALSHFYNPLTDKGYSLILDEQIADILVENGILIDGLDDYELYESLIGRAINENNTWSYNMARAYYYAALTEKYDPFLGLSLTTGTGPFTWKTYDINGTEDRDFYFAITYQALGNMMHLVQDSSVPAHTRNKLHASLSVRGFDFVATEPFEKWTKKEKNRNKLAENLYASVTPWKEFGSSGVAPEMFIDSGTLTESTVTPNLSPSLGLAEYSHANFLTEGSGSMYSFNLPVIPDWTDEFPGSSNEDYTFEDVTVHGESHKFVYLSQKKYEGGVDHLALAGILRFVPNYFGYTLTREYYDVWYTTDDEKVMIDYSNVLLPKAVSYSAGLLDYFFRGEIEISPVLPQDLTVHGDGNGSVSIFKIKANIRNATMDAELPLGEPAYPNEEMGAGTLLAVAKYMAGSETNYAVSNEIKVTNISSLTPEMFEFVFYKEPIPWTTSKIDLQVIFKGTLGTEENIAVAIGRRPLFDGTMQITPPSEYVYSIIDASDFYSAGVAQPQFFSTLKASLRNELADKELQNGTLTAIAAYRELVNYEPDLYVDDLGKEYVPVATDRLPTQSSSVSAPINIPGEIPSISPSSPTEVEFDFSNDQIPAGITDLYLYIVFEGALHDIATGTTEPNSFVIGIKDLNEPSHIVYGNSTDQVIVNGVLTNAETVKTTPEMAALADWNNNGTFNEVHIVDGVNVGEPFIDPYSISLQFAFSQTDPGSSSSPHKISIDSLPSGGYSKFIVLNEANPDPKDKFWITPHLSRHYGSQIETDHYSYPFEGVTSQMNDSLLWDSTPLEPDYLHRGVLQNRLFGEFFCLGSPCPYLGAQRENYSALTPHPITILP